MRVSIGLRPSLRVLLASPPEMGQEAASAQDGKRLAAILADDANGEKPLTHLIFLLNFFDELRRKVPVGK